MRTRIPVTFTPGTRSINTGITAITIEDIRLIVNETQMEVLCSSMQKPLIASVTNGVVTYVTSYQVTNDDGTTTTVTIPPLAAGDKITFEIDRCDTAAKQGSNPDASISAIQAALTIIDGYTAITTSEINDTLDDLWDATE